MKFPSRQLVVLHCLFFLGALTVCVRGDELDELSAALRRSADALDPKLQSSGALRMIVELEAAVAQGDMVRVQTATRQLETLPALPPEVKSYAEQLGRDLPRLLEARGNAFVESVQLLVERTRQECLNASAESDLQALLRDLSALKYRQPPRTDSPLISRAIRKLDAAARATEIWMDYLVAKTGGGSTRALQALRKLTNDENAFPILPLNEIEKRMAALPPRPGMAADFAPMLARMKSLADVEPISAEIEVALSPSEFGSMTYSADFRSWLGGFRAAVADYTSGNFGDAWALANTSMNSGQGAWFTEAVRLRSMLIDELFPKVLKLPPEAVRRPEETLVDCLHRLLGDAAAQGRWPDVAKLAGAGFFLTTNNRSSTNGMAETVATTKAFIEGQRLEAGNDYSGAVLAYTRVLRSTAEFSPVQEAIARLKELRQKQPQGFAETPARLEAEAALNRVDQLTQLVRSVDARAGFLEQLLTNSRAPAAQPAAPSQPAGEDANLKKIDARLKLLEGATRKDEISSRLAKLESLLGPGAEALRSEGRDDKKYQIWLGQDYTVYRSALPKNLEENLSWSVKFNGRSVLLRRASKEFFYRHFDVRPGNYSICLTTGGPDSPASNVLEYTITNEAAAKAPRTIDDDLDRDGVPNAVEKQK